MPAKIAPWLADALRRERSSRRWSQAELARRADVDPSHLSEIEGEKRTPNVETLEKLCDALGMPISALFREAERGRDGRR